MAEMYDELLSDLKRLAEDVPGIVGHRAVELVRAYRDQRNQLAAATQRAQAAEASAP